MSYKTFNDLPPLMDQKDEGQASSMMPIWMLVFICVIGAALFYPVAHGVGVSQIKELSLKLRSTPSRVQAQVVSLNSKSDPKQAKLRSGNCAWWVPVTAEQLNSKYSLGARLSLDTRQRSDGAILAPDRGSFCLP